MTSLRVRKPILRPDSATAMVDDDRDRTTSGPSRATRSPARRQLPSNPGDRGRVTRRIVAHE